MRLLLGPPGTGKTTNLLSRVELALAEGTPPDRIAFLAFTKKAANEAIARACEKFKMAKKDFAYFRTIHSLAFQQLGLSRRDILTADHLLELGSGLGLVFNATPEQDIDEPQRMLSAVETLGDRLLTLYLLAKSRGVTLAQQWGDAYVEMTDGMSQRSLEDFGRDYEAFKREKGVLDFSDILSEWQPSLDLDLLIVDEAQDLSHQQWQLILALAQQAQETVIAGDDDQAIYEWAGADIALFLSLKAEREILPFSHRLPRAIHAMADRSARHILARYPKTWAPRQEEGLVDWVRGPEEVGLVGDQTFFLLARTRAQQKRLINCAFQEGVVFNAGGLWSNQMPYVRAAVVYERMRKGEELTKRELAFVASWIVDAPEPKDDDPGPYGFDSLRWPFEGRPDWMTALTRLSVKEREYVRALRRNGEPLTGPGRVTISTIHGIKGGEADQVVMLTDVPRSIVRRAYAFPDAEQRVLYVGLSRAKRALTLVHPQTRWHWEI